MAITKKDTIILAVLLNLVVLAGVFVTAKQVFVSPDSKKSAASFSEEDNFAENNRTKEEAEGFDEIDQLLEEYDAKGKESLPEKELVPSKKIASAPQKKSCEIKDGLYVVRPGDNPWKIAKKFHLSFEKLLELNNLDETKARNLKVGQTLRIKET